MWVQAKIRTEGGKERGGGGGGGGGRRQSAHGGAMLPNLLSSMHSLRPLFSILK